MRPRRYLEIDGNGELSSTGMVLGSSRWGRRVCTCHTRRITGAKSRRPGHGQRGEEAAAKATTKVLVAKWFSCELQTSPRRMS